MNFLLKGRIRVKDVSLPYQKAFIVVCVSIKGPKYMFLYQTQSWI